MREQNVGSRQRKEDLADSDRYEQEDEAAGLLRRLQAPRGRISFLIRLSLIGFYSVGAHLSTDDSSQNYSTHLTCRKTGKGRCNGVERRNDEVAN